MGESKREVKQGGRRRTEKNNALFMQYYTNSSPTFRVLSAEGADFLKINLIDCVFTMTRTRRRRENFGFKVQKYDFSAAGGGRKF